MYMCGCVEGCDHDMALHKSIIFHDINSDRASPYHSLRYIRVYVCEHESYKTILVSAGEVKYVNMICIDFGMYMI